jgi:protein disulfide-isomerase A1
LFVQVDTSDDASARVSEFFGIEDDDTPTCRLINLESDMKKYNPDFEGLSADNIKAFVNNYLDGNLKVQEFYMVDYSLS